VDIFNDLMVEDRILQNHEEDGEVQENVDDVRHPTQVMKPHLESNSLADSVLKQRDESIEVGDVAKGIEIDTFDATLAGGEDNSIRPRRDGEKQKPCTYTTSCPPSHERSMITGPWSLEWLGDIDHGHAGVIFASRKKLKNKSSIIQRQQVKNKDVQMTKKKLDGVLRHPGGVSKR